MTSIVIATNNSGKFAEFQTLLAPLHCISQTAFKVVPPEETGLSFIENAIQKARHACEVSQHPALADDSGLVVPALSGKPGIYSARFAGIDATDEENIAFLLHAMEDIPEKHRGAYFYCALAYVKTPDDPTPLFAIGTLHGTVIKAPRGTHGFGYDPIVYIKDHHKTLAELPPEIKNGISHRAMALKTLQKELCHA